MKMVKKLLVGSLIAAAILALSGCGTPEPAGTKMIDANALGASIDYKNEETTLARGFEYLKQMHVDGVCYIKNPINKIDAPSNNLKTNGVMGFIFNIVENEEAGTLSFSIAGVRLNQLTNKVEAYVETFKDVEKAKLEEDLGYGTHAKVGTGAEAWGKDAFGFVLGAKDDFVKDDVFEVYIEVVANDGKTEGRMGAKDTYTVRFFKADPKRKDINETNKFKLGYKEGGADPIATLTIESTEVFNKGDNGIESMEGYMGYYANVQPGQTLKGEWKVKDKTKEAEIAE